ncbi:glycosyltransferase family A protein, partial [Sulfurovum sp. zt1-1]
MFSVVIPLYNKEQYIAKTLESVLLQTFQEYEIIVVDDGSTDKSTFEVKRYNDNRIRLIQQENAGVSAARNRGIEEANYDLIAFLDADDEWLPNHLQELINLRIDYPECEVFATG